MADVITVAALNRYVKSVLESDPVLLDIAVRGEISNFKNHYASGHCYFSIKDDKASVPAVMFRSDAQRLRFEPENGMGVVLRCRVSLYERDGRFQLYVQDMFPDGVGALQMAFEQLKKRLGAEGLFNEEHKKPIPAYPRRVGVVTSKTGAALQDILNVAGRRCPDANILLCPVTVQGNEAAPEISAAIRLLDENGRCDVIIVARGGGSMEDLWVFNAEEIARTVFACKTPVISAIGHEIDFTILDFVADLRAPTPSAAAELALPNMAEAGRHIMNLYSSIADNIHSRIETWYTILEKCKNNPALKQVASMPDILWQGVDSLSRDIDRQLRQQTALKQEQLRAAAQLAASLNPYAVLARGYSIAQKDGATIRSIARLQQQDKLHLLLADGSAECIVQSLTPQEKQNG